MKIACITGATGCVGRNLVDELLKEWHVIVLHRKSSNLSKLTGCDVLFHEVDLHDIRSVRYNVPPHLDAIFHVAANVSHWPLHANEQWKDNVLATRNLVTVALEKKTKRFMFTSTGATGEFEHTTEDEANRIESGYIRTKRLSELEVYKGIDAGLDAVILKPIIVMGKYDYNNYSSIFKYLKENKRPMTLPGNLAFCHAADVAKGHIQAFEKGRKGHHYYLSGEYTSWYNVFDKIAKLVGVAPPPKPLAIWKYKLMAYCMLQWSYLTRKEPLLTPELIYLLNHNEDIPWREQEKSFKELGYKSASLDVCLKDCHDWLLSEKMI